MKKLIYIVIVTLLVTACGTYRNLNLNSLTIGMTKAEVEMVAGSPYRVLAVNNTKDGYQEVLEYRTSRDEIYALEFWNDYLTGYEYLYEDIPYYPHVVPPVIWPEYGRPIIVVPNHRPGNRPNNNRPNNNNRPGNSNRPQTPGRVPNTNPRPNTNNNTGTGNRPDSSSTRPGSSGNGSSGRDTGRTTSSGSDTSSSHTSSTSGRTTR